MFSSTSFSLESKTFLNMVKSTFQGASDKQGENTPLINSSDNSDGGYTTSEQSEKGAPESSTKKPNNQISYISATFQSIFVQKKEPIDSSLFNAFKEHPEVIKMKETRLKARSLFKAGQKSKNIERYAHIDKFNYRLNIKDTYCPTLLSLKQAIEIELKNSLKKEKIDIQSINASLGSNDFDKSLFEAPIITNLSGKFKSNEELYEYFLTIYFIENTQSSGNCLAIKIKPGQQNIYDKRKSWRIIDDNFTRIKTFANMAVSNQLQINNSISGYFV